VLCALCSVLRTAALRIGGASGEGGGTGGSFLSVSGGRGSHSEQQQAKRKGRMLNDLRQIVETQVRKRVFFCAIYI
jgi:hypothetical protein